jgi:hypothetical protein
MISDTKINKIKMYINHLHCTPVPATLNLHKQRSYHMELPSHYTVDQVSNAVAGKRASLKITLQEYQSAYDKSAGVKYIKTKFFGLYKRVDPSDAFMFNYYESLELGRLKARIKRMDNTILVLSYLPKDAKVKLTRDELFELFHNTINKGATNK